MQIKKLETFSLIPIDIYPALKKLKAKDVVIFPPPKQQFSVSPKKRLDADKIKLNILQCLGNRKRNYKYFCPCAKQEAIYGETSFEFVLNGTIPGCVLLFPG